MMDDYIYKHTHTHDTHTYTQLHTHRDTLKFSKGKNKLCRDLSKWTNNKNLIEDRTILEMILNFYSVFHSV